MSLWSKFRFALAGLWRRNRAEQELDEELVFHIDMMTADNVRRGLDPAAARRAALVTFGGGDRFKEATRDARGLTWLDQLHRDLRWSLRLLRKSPQFTTVAVLTLALGIGANTAIFSVVNAVLLRASPFADPDRMVMVWETDRASDTMHEPASWPDVVDFRNRSRALSAIGSMTALAGTLTGAGEPERVAILGVTSNLPALLGVQPLHGRLFRAEEVRPNGARYALLAEEYWRRRFNADPGIVGQSLTINDRPIEVIGVLPAEADLGIQQIHAKADYSAPLAGREVDLWLAVEPTAASFPRQTHPFLTIGRLAPTASLAAAQQELAGIMTDLERTFPENAARGVNLEPYDNVTFGPVRPALLVLLSGVALVLLVACVNVANLLLARTAVRAREVGVRRALGASTGRIVRQFLLESLVLTTLGTVAGVALAQLGLRALIALAPPDIPRLAAASIDVRVLGFTALVAVIVALGFSVAPMFMVRGLDLQTVLKAQPGRGSTEKGEARRFRSALVVSEVALAVALVIGAGVLLRSFWALAGVDPGFRAASVLKVEYQLPQTRYPLTEINGFHAELLRRVTALPGVESAALAARHPLDPGFTNSFTVVGREAEAADWPEIRCRFITPGYLSTMKVPLVTGRELAAGDVAGAQSVAVINQAAADRYFAGRDPMGQQIRFWGVAWRIVGVIGNERFNGLAEAGEPAVYVPIAQAPQSAAVLLVRGHADPNSLIAGTRGVFRDLDPQLALYGVEPLEQTLAGSIAKPRFVAMLLALFGGVAIVLALVGVHGVLSYTVAQRASEVGIRMALGATRHSVVSLVAGDGIRLAVLGTALGIAAAMAGSRMLASLVFGVTPRDTGTFVSVAAAVLALAALASWLPARRAARTEPMRSLRAD